MSQVKQYTVVAGTIVHVRGIPFKLLSDVQMEGSNLMPASVQPGYVPPPGPESPPDIRHIHNPMG